MVSYINETDFVVENKKLVYPEIVTDGLQLYYDAKGKRDTDYHRDTMLDMSGNKNHGKLYNFAYEKHSGYKDGLVFDYIDDKLVRPALDLKPDDFTFMLNGNIISFSPDGTVKRVQDGEVIESKGFNMIRNGDFVDERNGWKIYNLKLISRENGIGKFETTSSEIAFVHQPIDKNSFSENDLIYTSFDSYIPHSATSKYIRWFDYENIKLAGGSSDSLTRWSGVFRTGKPHPEYGATIRHHAQGSPGTIIELGRYVFVNLTRTFGAGNEPTKEQMDEIIQRFGFIPNSQDLIDRLEYKGNDLGDMENIIDGLYKTEVLSGEEVYTDKSDDAVVHVDVDGKSLGGGSGKNLLTNNSAYWKVGSLTTMDGSDYSSTETLRSPYIELKKGTYTLSVSNNIGGYSSLEQYTYTYDSNKNGIGGSGWSPALSRRIEIPEDGCFIRTLIRAIPRIQVSLSDVGSMFNIQLEEGSTATAYEPPVPTPDYPISIHSLNDFDVVSSVGKENLLKDSKREWRTTREYVAPSYNLNEIFDKYPIGQTYTISFDAKSDDPSKKDSLQFYSNPGSTVQNKYIFATRSFTGLTTEYQRFSHTITPYLSADPSYPKSGMSFYGLYDTGNIPTIRNIKIELGTTATPYTISPKDIVGPDNQTSIDKINLLLDEPLRSVGDVKDRLFRDDDGVWKIERRIWVQVLDKNTTLNSSGAVSYEGTLSTSRYIKPTKYSLGYSTAMYELCTHLPHKNQVWSNDDYLFGTSVNGATQFHFRIPNDITGVVPGDSVGTRSSKINAWLESEKNKGNPFTIQYIMRDPEIETLPQTLQDKLNNLRSFEDSNYVYIVDGSTNLLDTVPLLNNHWYPSSGTLQNPVTQNGHTSTQEPLPVYPGAKIKLTKVDSGDNYWRIVWVDKDNNVVIREVSTVDDLILTAPNGAYGMRVSYPNDSNPVIKFDKSGITQNISDNLKPTLHAKFLYNNWYKEDRVINNLMIYNRALTDEEMLQNYKTIKRRWGM